MTQTKIDYNSTNNQRIKGKLIEREVYCCFSYEMDDILKLKPELLDDIENLYQTICPFCEDPVNWSDEINEKEKCPHCDEDLILETDLDSEPQEIFEWWIVSEHFAGKLREHGEPILEWGNNCYWGRTCTGQAILLDYVVSKIAEEMEILEPMQNSKYWLSA